MKAFFIPLREAIAANPQEYDKNPPVMLGYMDVTDG